ncbi:TPA: ATP-binding protein, partial [Escherichia coli]
MGVVLGIPFKRFSFNAWRFSHSGVGPFELQIGTFEFLSQNTSHTEREHSHFDLKAKKYAGLMIFRDSLRVLPYGRVDNDFFQIEERRSWN